jgi:hypothetical protein
VNIDDLERRLRRLDPVEGVPVEPATGPRAAALMEQIMNTPESDTATTVPTIPNAPMRDVAPSRPRWSKFAIGGGIAAALAIGAFAFATTGGNGGGATATAVTYQLGASDITAMCLPVTDYVPPATGLVGFRGTVAEVGDGTVTLDVTKWYAGGDADRVVLQTADLASVALDGVEFTAGGDYLVSVLDGTVQICGLSGPYSADYETIFAGWFAT